MDNNLIDAAKLKLKSATKLKLLRQRELCKIRDEERSVNEELAIVKAENEFMHEQLEDLKTQIARSKHQISMIEICSSSEKNKIKAHISNLENHRKGFQDIFDKGDGMVKINWQWLGDKNKQSGDEEACIHVHARSIVKITGLLTIKNYLHELRIKEIQEKESAEEEKIRQKEKELAEKNELEAREVAAIEAECDAVEQECAVLKKRNNALMLTLRRKLLETENARRELMKRNASSN